MSSHATSEDKKNAQEREELGEQEIQYYEDKEVGLGSLAYYGRYEPGEETQVYWSDARMEDMILEVEEMKRLREQGDSKGC